VGFPRVFLGDAAEVDTLVLCELHNQDWVLILSVVVRVPHRHHSVGFILPRLKYDIVGGHLARLLVRWALHSEAVPDTTLRAELHACALLVHRELVHVVADDRHQTDSVGDELVVEHRSVLAHLDQVDSHDGDFTDDDPAEGISH